MTPQELFERCWEEFRVFERPCANNSRSLLVLAEAAIEYINASPCDPDITSEQSTAWLKYQDALDSLKTQGEEG